MPGSVPSMAVQKKQSVIPPSQGPLPTRTIESHRTGNKSENTRASNGLNVDERLKAARERREEHQKLLASRELSRLEREQRAQRYYEQQLQERKKKLLEQRLKEERRRAAVEEKRRQRLRVEKERYESAVRRTLEKSQRVQQQLSQNSRGRKPAKNVSYHSVNTTTPCITHKLQHHPCSANHRPPASPKSNANQHRSSSPAQIEAVRRDVNKKGSNGGSGNKSRVKPATGSQIRATSPSPERSPRRSISRHSRPLQLELPSVPEEDAAACGSTFSAGNTRPVRGSGKGQPEKQRQGDPPETPCSNPSDSQPEALSRTALGGTAQAPEVVTQPSSGTSDPEEASRLLAEKRKVARLKREKEEQERPQREEDERCNREEPERRRAQERAQQEAEAQRLVEEKRRREEEEQRRAEEERAQAIKEAALLQKQREEELSKERERAEELKRERDTAAQKDEAERQARKKRLEEIMRRTRRTDSPDTKPALARILPSQSQPKENTVPAVQNGTIEDAVKLPVGAKSSQLGFSNEEDVVPVVAFRERRSLRALSGLEEIQTQQRAEVI
ncbi:ensconsin isoform X3 [Nothobranchius furzeri]|uniref:Transcript variant X3 n=1 Tax=Nothobranchius furzeri TaxID=105023 RepID=A0A9D3BBI6_NOTFU|nr:transcript variant X3 [Nothobranchius furzeri]